MKIEFGEIPNGFLSTVSYTKQKVSWIENDEGVDVGDKVGDKITENQQKILFLIKDNPSVSAQKLAEMVGVSRRKIEENLKKLKDTGKLLRIGKPKSGYWKVNDTNEI
jgi:predicted HTH transcriptional regulator